MHIASRLCTGRGTLHYYYQLVIAGTADTGNARDCLRAVELDITNLL